MNLITLILTLVLGGEPLLVITPPEWNLGRIEASGGIVSTEVVVENRSGEEAEIAFISSCECLRITPTRLQLAAGEAGHIVLDFDPTEESGMVQKDIIIRTDLDRLPKALYLVHGEVRGDAPKAEPSVAWTEEAEPSTGRAAGKQQLPAHQVRPAAQMAVILYQIA